MNGFYLVNDEPEPQSRFDFRMTIEEIREMKTLNRTESTMAFPFRIETARTREPWARPTVESASLSRIINIKAIRKLAYLTLPNRT